MRSLLMSLFSLGLNLVTKPFHTYLYLINQVTTVPHEGINCRTKTGDDIQLLAVLLEISNNNNKEEDRKNCPCLFFSHFTELNSLQDGHISQTDSQSRSRQCPSQRQFTVFQEEFKQFTILTRVFNRQERKCKRLGLR